MSTAVIVTQEGPIARVRFEATNEIHTLSAATRQSLSEELEKLNHVATCRVIIFEARGRTFLAGAELSELQGLHQDSAIWYAEAGQQLMNQIADLKALTICAIQAPCAGGGCELALACDFRFAAIGARIGLPETSLGLLPGWGGTVRATSILGPAIARRLILPGELLPAEEALRIGLVNAVFPQDDFRAEVDKFAAQLLTRGPQAVRLAKRLISQLSKGGLKKALAREVRRFSKCYANLEPLEGIAAFREKRAPAWTEAAKPESNGESAAEKSPPRKRQSRPT